MPDGTVAGRLLARGVQPGGRDSGGARGAPPDVCWDQPVPDRSNLLGAITAAQRARQFAAAETAADRLASTLRGTLGLHPHAVLAKELQGRCSVMTGRWDSAALCHLTAAVARHHLRAPASAQSGRHPRPPPA